MQLGWIALLIILGLLVGLQPDVYYVTKLERGDLVYSTLGEAIAAAKPGSTIKVKSGTYRENLIIDKPLRIEPFSIGEGSPKIIILAIDPNQPVFRITSNNVRLSGLVIEGGSVGIELVGVQGCRIVGNEIKESKGGIVLTQKAGTGRGAQGNLIKENSIDGGDTGIELDNSSENRLDGNEIAESSVGIRLSSSDDNELKGNRIEAAQTALLLEGSHRNRLLGNAISGSDRGLVFDRASGNSLEKNSFSGGEPLQIIGEAVDDWLQEIDKTNTIDGRAIYYLVGEENLTIDATMNPGYIMLIRCKNITVAGLNLSGQGILLIETEAATVRGNRITGAKEGISLWRSANDLLEGNTISGGEIGIHLRGSTAEILSQNDISGSGIGILIAGGGGDLLEGNEIAESARHGISLESSNNNRIKGNGVRGSKEYGILIRAARGNIVEANELLQNWVGLFLQGAQANTIKGNKAHENNFGIYLADSQGNKIMENELAENVRAGLAGSLEGNKVEGNKD